MAQTLYETSAQSASQNRRQVHSNVQDKINNAIVDIRLYDKGLKLFPATLQPQFVKYLLKTLGTELCNDIFHYVANECNLCYEGDLTTEQRLKIQQECAQEYRASLIALTKTLAGTSIEEFLTAAENALMSCSMIVKKVDKKKDRTLILVHKHELLDQLSKCQDAALVLHLCVLIIFTVSTQCILHASGKHVSAILSYLQPSLNDQQSATLMAYHDLILKLLSSDGDVANQATKDIEDVMKDVKDIANSYKKAGVTNAE
jgi:SHS2 domain-containing protein